ncbi:MAG TPA: hypothetical protein VGN75_14010 [Kaistia sp.]|nr:hypothetical protein [Kaistia sp.]
MTPATDPPSQAGWHLDKKVPLALIVTILIQTGVAIWFMGALSQRVTNIETALSSATDQPIRIVRVETQMEGVRDTLKEMNDKLDRLLGYPAPKR